MTQRTLANSTCLMVLALTILLKDDTLEFLLTTLLLSISKEDCPGFFNIVQIVLCSYISSITALQYVRNLQSLTTKSPGLGDDFCFRQSVP